MNWLIIIIVGILIIALIVFLVIRNQKDEKEFEKELDNDYHKPKSKDEALEIDELTDGMH
jgi:large-conductance mechanosensitive channel